jgi:hypothetical protein
MEARYQRDRGGVGLPNTAPRAPGVFADPVDAAFDSYLRNGMEHMTPAHRALASTRYKAAQGTTQ